MLWRVYVLQKQLQVGDGLREEVCVCLNLGRDGGQAVTEPFEEDLGVLAYPIPPTESLGLWASSELGSDANYE